MYLCPLLVLAQPSLFSPGKSVFSCHWLPSRCVCAYMRTYKHVRARVCICMCLCAFGRCTTLAVAHHHGHKPRLLSLTVLCSPVGEVSTFYSSPHHSPDCLHPMFISLSLHWPQRKKNCAVPLTTFTEALQSLTF